MLQAASIDVERLWLMLCGLVSPSGEFNSNRSIGFSGGLNEPSILGTQFTTCSITRATAEFVPTVSTNTIWFGFKYIRDQLAEVGGVFAEKLEGVLAVFGEIRGGGPVWDVESGGTVCVLVADCQWPQSRTCLKPETTRVTFEEFSPTHAYFDYRTGARHWLRVEHSK